MIVEILQKHRGWKPGAIVDVTRNFGADLIRLGIARAHEDQTRRDYTPTVKKEDEPQKIEVHNYFIEPPEDAKPKRKKKISKPKQE